MKNIESIFSRLSAALCCVPLVCSLAQAQLPVPPAPESHPATKRSPVGDLSGRQLIADAARRTAGHTTVSARVRLRTRLLGQQLIGYGSFSQLSSSRGLLLRMELAIPVGEQLTSVKQICDGRDLWIHRRLAEQETLGHVDLRRVEEAAKTAPDRIRAEAASSVLASGGLPKLLQQLQANFDFGAVPLRQAQLGDVPAWIATGSWQPHQLVGFLPEQREAISAGQAPDLSKLPAHVPDSVTVTVGQDDLFPYRIAFLRHQRPSTPEGHVENALVVVEFFEVAIGTEIDPRQFDYRPGRISVADHTELFIQSLGLANTQQQQQQRR